MRIKAAIPQSCARFRPRWVGTRISRSLTWCSIGRDDFRPSVSRCQLVNSTFWVFLFSPWASFPNSSRPLPHALHYLQSHPEGAAIERAAKRSNWVMTDAKTWFQARPH